MSKRSVLAIVATLASVVGLSSGVAFAAKSPPSTTASTTEFSQCSNGGPPSTNLGCNNWINGILNASNSHYAEDQVTPQRLLMSVPGGTGRHTVTIRYLARKGNVNAHAYDSLATWNVTQTAAQPCQSLSAAICAGTPSTLDMKSDPTPVPPATSPAGPITSAHELPQASRQWTLYGGSLVTTTVPVHDNAPNLGTDDYAKVTVTFDATASNVLLLFGGHLAPGTGPRGWGAGLGAANISGGPYHIILDAVDGTGGGRDNQIMAGAILAGSPSYTIVKTATDANGNPVTTASPDQPITYTIKVTNTGTADGSTSFVDDYDNQLNPPLPTSTPSGGTCVRDATGAPTGSFTCTTSLLTAGGGTQSFTYTVNMPSSFDSNSSHGTCGPTSFSIQNTATLITGGTSGTTICVSASPTWGVAKSASPSVANPGQQVTYTITITNTGTAPGVYNFVDDYDNRITNRTAVTTTPTGGSCTDNGDTFTCSTNIAIDPGHTMVFTYKANMPLTFTGSSDPCAPGQFPVKNVIVNTPAQFTVCVNASPTITYAKTAYHADGSVATTASPGETITYKIVLTNGGTAPGSKDFTDNFDDNLSPSAVTTSDGIGSCTQSANGSDKFFSCHSGNLDPGQSRTFTYTATMPNTFDGTPGTNGCSASNPEQFAVHNVVLEGTTQVAQATVCVNASPDFHVVKRAFDQNGVEMTPTHPASPGDKITYVITVSNTGKASGSTSFDDDYDNRLTPSAVTKNPNTGSCSDNGSVIHCDTGTIAAGGQQTFTYTANMPSTFTGFPGGFGCSTSNPHQYPVHNVVLLDNGQSDDATVCVNASPNLSLVKSAVVTTDDNTGSQTITYTLTYTNNGPAEATLAGISETVPTGTSYVSCTGGCTTTGSPVTGVSWQVGPIAPNGGTGSVTLTVKVTTTTACSITNTATIQFMNDTAVSSNTLVTNVNPVPNPAGAHASGSAIAAQVLSSGLIGVNTAPISPTSSSQSGLGGPDVHSNALLSINVPSNGSLLGVTALKTTSSSQVTGAPPEARDTSTAEVAHVCVLPVAGLCTVEADTVRAVASTTAGPNTASWSSAGSTIQNLKVLGLGTPVDLNQTTRLDLAVLSPLVFAKGSYVAINERTGTATLSGGSYKADLTVTMIHVKATLLAGLQSAEVIVARATAHSDFPALPNCAGTRKAVSGDAYVAGATVVSGPLSTLIDLKQGFVEISPLGGAESQHIAAVALPSNGSLVAAQAADSSSSGGITPTTATSGSAAEVAGDNAVPACVLKSGTTCVVTATVIHSEAHSAATSAGSTSTDAGTSFLDLRVLGIPIAGTPAPNTVINLPGLGYLVLNEQFCDLGGLATHSCTGATHSGITVRAVDLVINVANNPLGLVPGVQVVVAEAHADSTYG